jgi:hypothetical protein
MESEMNTKFLLLLALTFVIGSLAPQSGSALAHEDRELAGLNIELGFEIEPPVEGLLNGIVVIASTEDRPAEGLDQTLKLEVFHTESRGSKELRLEPVFGTPGRYLAPLIPTATGQYSVRLFGTVGNEDVDAAFVSGPDTFDDVVPATSLQFPNEIPSTRELEAVARDAQNSVNEALDAADDADSSAGFALTVGIIGIVLGALGLGVGAFAMTSRKTT